MTATLVAKNLAAGHGDRSLFAGLDLVVAPGDVIGLVGANGAGKSTLLRMLAGLTRPEQGELRLSPPAATVGHLPQEPERRPGETVRASSPAAPASPRPSGRWTTRPRPWSTARPAPTTPTPPAWNAGWRSAAPTSTSAPRRWPAPSASPSASTSR
ncbi:Vitamin B12 import ATP-binding protein BtuD [Streptomyces fumanus]